MNDQQDIRPHNNAKCTICNTKYLVAGIMRRKDKEDCAEGIPLPLKIWCEKCQKIVLPIRINHEYVDTGSEG